MSYEFLDESVLSAYLDGELSASETERVEQAIESSASLRQLLEELRLVRRLVVDAVLHAVSMDEAGGEAMSSSDPSFPNLNSKPSSGETFGSPAPWLVDRRHPAPQSPSAASDEKTSSASVGETALAKVDLPSPSWWTARNVAMAVSALAASWLLGLLVFSARERTDMPMASQSGAEKSSTKASPAVRGRRSESETNRAESRFHSRGESGLTQLNTSGVGLPETTSEENPEENTQENTQENAVSEHRGLQEGGLGLGKEQRPVHPSSERQDLRFAHPEAKFGVDPAARGAIASDAPSIAGLANAAPSAGGMAGGSSPSMPPNPKRLGEQENPAPSEAMLAIVADDSVSSEPSEIVDAASGNSEDYKLYRATRADWYMSLSEVKELALQVVERQESEFSKNEKVLSERSQLTSREYAQERFLEDVGERLLQVEASLGRSLTRANLDFAERDGTAGTPSESDGDSNATPSPQAVLRTLYFGYVPSDIPQATQGSWVVTRAHSTQNSATSRFSHQAARVPLAIPASDAPPASGDAPPGTGSPELKLHFRASEPSSAMTAFTGGVWLLFTFRESDSEPALQALRQLGVQWEGMEINRDPLVLLQAKTTVPTFADEKFGFESQPGEVNLLARGSWDTNNLPALNSGVKDGADRFDARAPIDFLAKEIEPHAEMLELSEPVRMRVVAIYLVPASESESNPE